jgi:hypothetical protein
MPGIFEQQDVLALLGEQRCRGAAGWSTADHENVGHFENLFKKALLF